MQQRRIGVVRGGPGAGYRDSLETGRIFLQNMPEKCEPVDIFVDTRGVWHIGGIPTTLERVREEVDMLVNALHGAYGSDGQLQRHLERHHIRYTGAGVTGSAHAFNRPLTKEIIGQHGLRTPHGIVVHADDDDGWERAVKTFFTGHPAPYIVKNVSGHGTSMHARTLAELFQLVSGLREEGEHALIEEYITGNEVRIGVLDNYRNERYYATIPSRSSSPELLDIARQAHSALGVKDYSVVHIIDSRRGPFVIKVDAHPPLHERSFFGTALEAIGCSVKDFVARLVRATT